MGNFVAYSATEKGRMHGRVLIVRNALKVLFFFFGGGVEF